MATNNKKLKTFKSMLSGLTCEKHKIGHLTEQARADLHHDETLAEVDVNAITSFIVNKNANDRLAGLYLIDSICQNVSGKYVPLFEEHIFPLIETTYRYGSSQTRKSLCKILSIWKSRKIFPIDILRNIYKAISNEQSQPMNYNYDRGPPPPAHAPAPAPHGPPLVNYNYPPYPHYAYYNPYYAPSQSQSQSQAPVINPSGWQSMCLKHNISPTQYESVIKELLSSISAFIESPYAYQNGIFVETPALKHANWSCPRSIFEELSKSRGEFMEFGMDITRKLYFICTELKDCGVNTWIWQSKLKALSPFIFGDKTEKKKKKETKDVDHKKINISICEFYNSVDGCRSGSNCQYLHVTNTEAQLRRHLLERVNARYQYKDIKFMDDCCELKITTFYTYFGAPQELKKKHTRSISLLYSKKLKVCPNCWLRISADSFSAHMKWHFDRRNEILMKKRRTGFKSQQYGMYRSWYQDEKQWLNSNDTNLANDKLSQKDEMNPFENIIAHNPIKPAQTKDNALQNMNEDNKHFEESQVTLNGISQKVICSICNEEFAKTNKEYNAQKDDWILKNACYSDGTNANANVKRTDIVHRKCYELKKKQNKYKDADGLKPKLLNKNNPILKIEMHLNENQNQKQQNKTRKRKRKINHLFAASDDEEDDADDADEEDDADGADGGDQEKKKKRKLNDMNQGISHKKDDIQLNEEELAKIEQDLDLDLDLDLDNEEDEDEDEDDDDDDAADIVLFDPDAYNDGYQRGYGYRGAY